MVVLLLMATLGGLLLFASDYPLHLFPLQLVALVPVLWALRRPDVGWGKALLAGLVLGVSYVTPLLVVLEFPLALGAALGAYLVALWALVFVAARAVQYWPLPWGPLAVGAAAVVVEWVDISVVPVWGTAQVFTRVWSAAPPAAQIVSLSGVLGLVFVVVALQALAAAWLREVVGRPKVLRALGLLLLATAAMNAALWLLSEPRESVRVAAVGWTSQDRRKLGRRSWERTLGGLLRPAAKRAAADGAKLLVAPEVAFRVGSKAAKGKLLAALAATAKDLRLALVAGYFDAPAKQNRIAFFSARGEALGQYTKSHLIPFIETYRPGDGSIVVTKGALPGKGAELRLGGMICQDDNFTDLARAHGRRGAQIVAVPTNDWAQVKHYHFENAIFRAMENSYGVVRGATNGISAVISPRGVVLATRDHFDEGPGAVVADLPISPGGPTLYSRLGDTLAALCGLALVVGFVVTRRRRSQRSGDHA